MRTETDHTENTKEWAPFGPKVEKPSPKVDEWQKSPDAPGVEYNWKTGKTRTNLPIPNTWVEDLAMQAKDAPKKRLGLFDAGYWGEWNRTKGIELLKEMVDQELKDVYK